MAPEESSHLKSRTAGVTADEQGAEANISVKMYGRSDSPYDDGRCLSDSRFVVLHMLLYTHLDLHLSSYQRTRVGSSCATKTCHHILASCTSLCLVDGPGTPAQQGQGLILLVPVCSLVNPATWCLSEDTHPQPLNTMTCRAKKLVSLPSSGARSNSDDEGSTLAGLLAVASQRLRACVSSDVHKHFHLVVFHASLRVKTAQQT